MRVLQKKAHLAPLSEHLSLLLYQIHLVPGNTKIINITEDPVGKMSVTTEYIERYRFHSVIIYKFWLQCTDGLSLPGVAVLRWWQQLEIDLRCGSLSAGAAPRCWPWTDEVGVFINLHPSVIKASCLELCECWWMLVVMKGGHFV